MSYDANNYTERRNRRFRGRRWARAPPQARLWAGFFQLSGGGLLQADRHRDGRTTTADRVTQEVGLGTQSPNDAGSAGGQGSERSLVPGPPERAGPSGCPAGPPAGANLGQAQPELLPGDREAWPPACQ